MSLDLKLPDARRDRSARRGARLGRAGRPRDLTCAATSAAGKTTLVRGLLRALGHAGRVKSPTYTLVEPYELSSLHFYHFDFYRLKNQEEWEQAGFREYFNGADAAARSNGRSARTACLPPPDLDIELRFEGERRPRHARRAQRAWRVLAFLAALLVLSDARGADRHRAASGPRATTPGSRSNRSPRSSTACSPSRIPSGWCSTSRPTSFRRRSPSCTARSRAEDPYIKGLSVARNRPGVIRLVLDLKADVKPQLFSLPPVAEYGHRLVLDIYPAGAGRSARRADRGEQQAAGGKAARPRSRASPRS